MYVVTMHHLHLLHLKFSDKKNNLWFPFMRNHQVPSKEKEETK